MPSSIYLVYMNETEETPSQDMKQYYVLGIVVLIAVVVAGYMLRPKNDASMTPSTTQQQVAVPTPTPGQITKLACDVQYYNSRIGYPEYYLSVEGGDVASASSVDCTFTASVKNTEEATVKVTSPLTASPARGGSTFRCTTKATPLTPGVVSTVAVALKDDLGSTATCSGVFTFPKP